MTEKRKSGSPAVQRMFSSIADRYDLLNRLFSFGTDVRWRREITDELYPGTSHPILDLASGTGEVALSIHDRSPGDNLIVGVDFALPMLKIASGKIQKHEATQVRLAAGDALALPFDDGAFGAVTIAFGLRNLPYRIDGLKEMHRVIQPGGKLIVLEFSRMDRAILGPLFRFYFHYVMPMLGGIISGNRGAYEYLPRSVDDFPDPLELGQELFDAGFSGVRYRPLTLGIAYLHVGEK